MPFVDTHVHLHFPEYQPDLDDVLSRSKAAGVEAFINVGTDFESSQASLNFARKYDFIYASAGIHPNDCKDTTSRDIEQISEILQQDRMVAIGEIGLDFYRDHAPKEKQKEVLRAFIQIYKKIKKPLIIHCRDAYEDLKDLFEDEKAKPYQGVMHCYSSDKEVMKKFLDLGFYISFAGPLTYKKNDSLREACKACPLDRLLFETDGPFLPPQSKRGKRNESGFMIETAETAAGLHGLSLEKLGEITTANAKKLFSL